MRPAPALFIVSLLVAAVVAGGAALDWAAHPSLPKAFAGCRTGPQLAPGEFAGPPPMCIDPKLNYSATLVTTKGEISFVFLARQAPVTVNNFIVLAAHGYYDGLRFFKVQDWEVQTGDPENDGRGGPGYSLPPEPSPPDDTWVPGSLGMARFPDGSISGSQFFILKTAWPGGNPTTPYNHFATVTLGFDIVGQLDSSDRILQVKLKAG